MTKKRHELYAQQTKFAQEALLKDIDNWYRKLPEKSVIGFHVGQFQKFCTNVFEHPMQEPAPDISKASKNTRLPMKYSYGNVQIAPTVVAEISYDKPGASAQLVAALASQWTELYDEDRTTFRSQVIGALTAQWTLLRQVASQRIDGSPYQTDLDEIDRQTAKFYRLLFESLPQEARQRISPNTPLTFLGRAAELALFNNQNQRAPALISIPFGAIYSMPDSRNLLAAAHEIGHTFDRIRPFHIELVDKVRNRLDEKYSTPSPQQKILHPVILQWLSEIVADTVAAAVAGPEFGASGLPIMASPEARLGITDETHPVALIRPYIVTKTLDYLVANHVPFDSEDSEGLEQLKKDIAQLVEPDLDRPFESIPALAIIPLSEVKDEMIAIIEIVFDTELVVLGNKTLGYILRNCAVRRKKTDKLPLEQIEIEIAEWADGFDANKPFVLDLSNFMPPEYAVPVTFPDWFCRITGLC